MLAVLGNRKSPQRIPGRKVFKMPTQTTLTTLILALELDYCLVTLILKSKSLRITITTSAILRA